ncbi:MAG: hypothetical protein NTW62_00940 [Candidatus Nomurabacteria bacterium]|nr:hypothetical protein [Candidatus Nomurabacteria bacterium]
MRKNIIITGLPHCGKSTLLKKIISDIEKGKSKQSSFGLVTTEILEKPHRRIGFKMGFIENERNSRATEIITLKEWKNKPGLKNIGSYGVNLNIIAEICQAVHLNYEHLDFIPKILYLDEIGPMQVDVPEFQNLTEEFLDSEKVTLMTMASCYYHNSEQHPFVTKLKKREDVRIIELYDHNREETEEGILELIDRIQKEKIKK